MNVHREFDHTILKLLQPTSNFKQRNSPLLWQLNQNDIRETLYISKLCIPAKAKMTYKIIPQNFTFTLLIGILIKNKTEQHTGHSSFNLRVFAGC